MPVFVAPSIHTRGNGGYKYDSEVIADRTARCTRTRGRETSPLLRMLSEILRGNQRGGQPSDSRACELIKDM